MKTVLHCYLSATCSGNVTDARKFTANVLQQASDFIEPSNTENHQRYILSLTSRGVTHFDSSSYYLTSLYMGALALIGKSHLTDAGCVLYFF